MEIENLILFLNISNCNLIKNVFELLKVRIFHIATFQKNVICMSVIELSSCSEQ